MGPRASLPPTTLRGRSLLLARIAWVAVAITALARVLFSIPSSFEHFRTVCTAPSQVCSERAIEQPTPRACERYGRSACRYAPMRS